jgi:hypothetical protein
MIVNTIGAVYHSRNIRLFHHDALQYGANRFFPAHPSGAELSHFGTRSAGLIVLLRRSGRFPHAIGGA